MKKAFTLIELIFAIVIIGVLASVAIPKFAGLNDNSKIAAELSTAASVQAALDSCHGEWIINEGSFKCGKSISNTDLTNEGYPKNDKLGDNENNPLNKLLKNASNGTWTRDGNNYRGPASNDTNNVKCKENKPCKDKHWKYDDKEGTFTLTDD